MTDQRDKAIDEPAGGVEQGVKPLAARNLSRRMMLRGVAIAAPTILTMNTASAALARTSIATYTGTDAPQGDNQYYCLSQKSTLGPPGSNENVLEVGSSPTPYVAKYQDRDFHDAQNNGNASAVTEVEMCRDSAVNGTTYYYKPTGSNTWQPVNVERGILLSASPMTSLGVTAVKIDNL